MLAARSAGSLQLAQNTLVFSCTVMPAAHSSGRLQLKQSTLVFSCTVSSLTGILYCQELLHPSAAEPAAVRGPDALASSARLMGVLPGSLTQASALPGGCVERLPKGSAPFPSHTQN